MIRDLYNLLLKFLNINKNDYINRKYSKAIE